MYREYFRVYSTYLLEKVCFKACFKYPFGTSCAYASSALVDNGRNSAY